MKHELIERRNGIAIVKILSPVTPYVVVSGYNRYKDGSWDSGQYYSSGLNAFKEFNRLDKIYNKGSNKK